MAQRRPRKPATPEPPRPLGSQGLRLWERYAAQVDPDEVALAAELADEHYVLRARVIREGDPADRRALRDIEERLTQAVRRLDTRASWNRYAEGAPT